MAKSNEELEREIAELKAKIATLTPTNPSSTPFAKFDPTTNFTMPQSAIDAMTRAVGDNLMRDIVKDHRRGVSPPSSMIASDHSEQPRPQIGQNGWIDPRPLTTPHIDNVDRIAQGFAEREWRER